MNIKRWLSLSTIILLLVITYHSVFGGENSSFVASPPRLPDTVILSARSGFSIEFKTQNGRNIEGTATQTRDIPHLILKRNGQLAASEERSLLVELNGIQVPFPGVNVTLNVETQHEESFLGGAENSRIRVWNETQWLPNPEQNAVQDMDVKFGLEFGERISQELGAIDTPTDYFRYEIRVSDQNGSIIQQYSSDYAFLMENQWEVELPAVLEDEPGAAPDELVVYYADMFNYERDPYDASSRLYRNQVQDYVSQELVPAMVSAYKLQSEDWGFAWYAQWTSYRSGVDSERLSVALTDPGLWYHGWAPGSAHSGISINTNSRSYASYDRLLDGMMSAFQHELFHNHQRGINQHLGGNGDVSGEGNKLAFFTEGMALMASSVGDQQVEYAPSRHARDYLAKANAFIAGDEFYADSLNTSYSELDAYATALYWRFLYDQCGGMDVMHRTLEVLYSPEGMKLAMGDLADQVAGVMDLALASPEAGMCPFKTYEDSLAQFTRAIYALHLEGGRCGQVRSLSGCGFYDPQNVYETPQIDSIVYSGQAQRHTGEIGSSYGMDFVEVNFSSTTDGQPLSVIVSTDPANKARFNLQALMLSDRGNAITEPFSHEIATETVHMDAEGNYCLPIGEVDHEQISRMGIMITRVDADEDADPIGSYSIDVIPGNGC